MRNNNSWMFIINKYKFLFASTKALYKKNSLQEQVDKASFSFNKTTSKTDA